MKRKKSKKSVSERILELRKFLTKPRTVKEIALEIKDRFGYSIKSKDIAVNLLYLLRREKIKRAKEEKIYKYYI